MLVVRLLFGVLFLAAFGAAAIFIYRRTVRDTLEQTWARRLLGGLLVAMMFAVPAIRFAFRDEVPPPWMSTVVLFGWGWLLYTLMGLLVLEVTRRLVAWRRTGSLALNDEQRLAQRVGAPATDAAPKLAQEPAAADVAPMPPPEPASPPPAPAPLESPGRRLFLARAAATSALAFGGGASIFGTWKAFTPAVITEVPVRLAGLPKALEGFTIVQLTDIHVGAIIQERFLDQLVATANSAKPDLIAITGDLVDGTPSALGRYVARLRNLKSRFGTYFVSGNHDYYSGWELWSHELEGIDFEVLRNRSVSIGDAGSGASFDLIGVDDWGTRVFRNGYDLDKAVTGHDPARASVLLAHQPSGLELAAEKKLGLQLSGHTHGGQLFPATLVGDVIWGQRNAGLSRLGDTQLYTSRGCGFVGPPMRIGAPPEVVKVILLPA